MKQQKTWAQRTPEEREKIKQARENASYNSPFTGKNKAQRARLHNGFAAMNR
jgi:hypothetical protein